MITAEQVREVFINAQDNEEDQDYLYELAYLGKGEDIDLKAAPDTWKIIVHDDAHAKTDYDSYGYSTLENGFLVIKVSDPVEEKYFSIPVHYASYSGWDFHFSNIQETRLTEKTILVWEVL